MQEAERHKWIESQKHGRDLGDPAIQDWYRRHWHGYCRCKRIEHVLGRRCWREFEEDAFGQLYALIVTGDLLLDRVLDRVDFGDENLDLILWAIEWGLPVRRVVMLLELININRARLEPDGE